MINILVGVLPHFEFQLRYGPPRDAPILSTCSEPSPIRRCHSDVTTPVNHATNSSPSSTDLPLSCQLIRQEDVTLHEENAARLGSGSFGVVRRGDWKTPTGKTVCIFIGTSFVFNRNIACRLNVCHLSYLATGGAKDFAS